MASQNSKYGKKKSTPMPDLGRIPPQAIDVEEVVIGAVMIEPDAYSVVGDIIDGDCFYKEAHQHIFKAITELFAKSEPIDLLTVSDQLKKNGKLEEVGGMLYLSDLTTKVAGAAHIEHHAKIVHQKFLQRELIKTATRIQNEAFDDSIDVKELIDNAENSIYKLSQGSHKNDSSGINPILKAAIERLEQAALRKDAMSGLASGYTGIDKMTSGWQPADLIIIAARPAMGKTAFVLSMARNIALDYRKAVAVFSLEMSNLQLVNRFIVSETEISAEKIKTGQLADYEWEQLHTKIKNLHDAPIYLDDTPGLSVFELRAKCRRLKERYDIQVIIIDYLQLMSAQGMNPGSRQEEVSIISRSLKMLAKELEIPVIALSQLNRGVESRVGDAKRPQLSDLRESGAIEQDADMVMMIHRPEYYGITEDSEGNSMVGMAEIIIAKHRNGSTGIVPLRFKAHLARFIDPEKESNSVYFSAVGSDVGQDNQATNGFSSGSVADPLGGGDPLSGGMIPPPDDSPF